MRVSVLKVKTSKVSRLKSVYANNLQKAKIST